MNCIVHGVAKSWTQLSDFEKNSKSQLSLLVCVSVYKCVCVCVFSDSVLQRKGSDWPD